MVRMARGYVCAEMAEGGCVSRNGEFWVRGYGRRETGSGGTLEPLYQAGIGLGTTFIGEEG
jgi:hypothetical protein